MTGQQAEGRASLRMQQRALVNISKSHLRQITRACLLLLSLWLVLIAPVVRSSKPDSPQHQEDSGRSQAAQVLDEQCVISAGSSAGSAKSEEAVAEVQASLHEACAVQPGDHAPTVPDVVAAEQSADMPAPHHADAAEAEVTEDGVADGKAGGMRHLMSHAESEAAA
eukprot:CAMPEP_0202875896 /NCGR_PEP_ID=MMETSP1391-20130828/28111_1 /ASSEMBLY_ACC=CAM_ASM_000867 /TAXON_ID=1034604 /ORGANISM="Chlamydomonas leiostraca, Strain SAG 11-49" /LENGTH=166 /DNA_ID=CAMNT_0049557649 /DNA_START=42 /DNA_END=539 /DNA_ORIENTATION=+